MKNLVASLPQRPKTAHSARETHSQTGSADEHSWVGLQSFLVLNTDGHRCRGASGSSRRVFKKVWKFWFVIAVAFVATVALVSSIAIVIRTSRLAQVYRPAGLEDYRSAGTGYWLISDGSLIVSCEHVSDRFMVLTRLVVFRYTHTHTHLRIHLRTHTHAHTHTHSVLKRPDQHRHSSPPLEHFLFSAGEDPWCFFPLNL